jgi:hypothetical protein
MQYFAQVNGQGYSIQSRGEKASKRFCYTETETMLESV